MAVENELKGQTGSRLPTSADLSLPRLAQDKKDSEQRELTKAFAFAILTEGAVVGGAVQWPVSGPTASSDGFATNPLIRCE